MVKIISDSTCDLSQELLERYADKAVGIKVYFAGAIFMLIYNFGAAILRAAGDTKTPLIFLLISGVINVILNIIFVTIIYYK